MSKTPILDELIKDVNPKSRNADYWMLKHKRVVDLARRMEEERGELREALHAAVCAKEAELEAFRRNLGRDPLVTPEWLPAARAILERVKA